MRKSSGVLIMTLALLAVLAPVLCARWPPETAVPEPGQSYTQVSSHGGLDDTGRLLDLTSGTDLVSALIIVNDGSNELWFECGVASVAAMTQASGEVLAGEVLSVPIRCRYLAIVTSSGETTNYRVLAGY